MAEHIDSINAFTTIIKYEWIIYTFIQNSTQLNVKLVKKKDVHVYAHTFVDNSSVVKRSLGYLL